jgi:glutamate racemase
MTQARMRRAIGIFDSGIGGLTVLKALQEALPHEDFVYFGDIARQPYGVKSKETILRFSIENVLFLLKFDVKAVVVACNTASSYALDYLQKSFKVPVIGVIIPGATRAAQVTRNRKVGVIGTLATVRSGAYHNAIKGCDPKIKVFSRACPLFVPLVEEGLFDDAITHSAAKKYLASFEKTGIDTLVLGCTHYPPLKKTIGRVVGKNVRLIDSAEQVALYTKNILRDNRLLRQKSRARQATRLFVSDKAPQLLELAKKILNSTVISKIELAHSIGS